MQIDTNYFEMKMLLSLNYVCIYMNYIYAHMCVYIYICVCICIHMCIFPSIQESQFYEVIVAFSLETKP